MRLCDFGGLVLFFIAFFFGEEGKFCRVLGRMGSRFRNGMMCRGIRQQDSFTYLVYHIRQQTFHLVALHAIGLPTASQPDGRNEFLQWHPRPPDPLAILSFLEPAREKDLSQQVPQRNVPAPLESEVDAAFDHLVFARGKGGIEA